MICSTRKRKKNCNVPSIRLTPSDLLTRQLSSYPDSPVLAIRPLLGCSFIAVGEDSLLVRDFEFNLPPNVLLR